MLKRLKNRITHHIHTLPILVLMPHSRCNCRCVMCDIWKANHEKREIAAEELEKHLIAFRKLGLKKVALSGGEALMHSNLWLFCDLLHSIDVKISLLSTGVTLKQHAKEVLQHCDDLIVSLDGSREIHNLIRNIPNAFERLEEGVKALKTASARFRITGRSVLQKKNFRDFPGIVRAAKDLGLDQISFLAADVTSEAFNRPDPWKVERVSEVALTASEVAELSALLEKSFVDFEEEYEQKFIAESPAKMRALAIYYLAILGLEKFPSKKCNAPWISAVIESNGDVLPCFFHKAYGNIYQNSFQEIINSPRAVSFRKKLDIDKDLTCQRCVCSLHLGLTQSV